MVAPTSRFSNTADTGIRVSRNTHAPLSLPGTLSTVGHWDQSRVAMFWLSFIVAPYHGSATVSRAGINVRFWRGSRLCKRGEAAGIDAGLHVAVARALEIHHRRGEIPVAHPFLQRADVDPILSVQKARSVWRSFRWSGKDCSLILHCPAFVSTTGLTRKPQSGFRRDKSFFAD